MLNKLYCLLTGRMGSAVKQAGFTTGYLVVAGGFLVLAFSGAMGALHNKVKTHGKVAQESSVSMDSRSVADAVIDYFMENAEFPQGVSDSDLPSGVTWLPSNIAALAPTKVIGYCSQVHPAFRGQLDDEGIDLRESHVRKAPEGRDYQARFALIFSRDDGTIETPCTDAFDESARNRTDSVLVYKYESFALRYFANRAERAAAAPPECAEDEKPIWGGVDAGWLGCAQEGDAQIQDFAKGEISDECPEGEVLSVVETIDPESSSSDPRYIKTLECKPAEDLLFTGQNTHIHIGGFYRATSSPSGTLGGVWSTEPWSGDFSGGGSESIIPKAGPIQPGTQVIGEPDTITAVRTVPLQDFKNARVVEVDTRCLSDGNFESSFEIEVSGVTTSLCSSKNGSRTARSITLPISQQNPSVILRANLIINTDGTAEWEPGWISLGILKFKQ